MILNTKEKGIIRFVIFPHKKQFVGVCLDFNIIEEGENPRELMESLEEAAIGHVEVVIKEKLSDELLNRHAPKRYWDKYNEIKRKVGTKKKRVKIRISSPQKTKEPVPFFIPLTSEFAYTQ